ncbi:MAG: SapC family protein, partial [Woeseia sp.]|nr:SapC family protein [Woeseia sp.]
MTNHVLLDNVTHKDLRINRVYGADQGDNVNVARVFPVEFGRLQNEYPLFFYKNAESGHFETIALLGFGNDENLFLSESGWDASCIPLTIERQPFLIGFQEQELDGMPSQVPVVHIDTDHPSVSKTDGEPVFLPQGGETPYLERISAVLKTIHQGHAVSESFSQLLVGLELIEPVAVDIELENGMRQGLDGLYTINEDKLKTLSASALETMHKKGHLQDVFMVLASMPNLAR